jgi:hypothetical protein
MRFGVIGRWSRRPSPRIIQQRATYREALSEPKVFECRSWRSRLESNKMLDTRGCRRRIYLQTDLNCRRYSTDNYLTEIRNVIKSKDDIERLWPGKDFQKMKFLCMDGGQACVFGSFAHLPMGLGSSDKGKGKDNAGERQDMEGVVVTSQKAIVDAGNQSQVCERGPNPASL